MLIKFIQEYEEDSNSEPDVDLENQYYNSKAMKENDPNGALNSFQMVIMAYLNDSAAFCSNIYMIILNFKCSFCQVLELEEEKGEWGFKALKQMTKINFKIVRCKFDVLFIYFLHCINAENVPY